MKKFILICLLSSCMLLGCTEKDSKDGHNKTLGDYIIEDLMDD
ncbi:hypothetical protein PSPHG_CDS_0039 [Pseudomonas phage Psxphi15]